MWLKRENGQTENFGLGAPFFVMLLVGLKTNYVQTSTQRPHGTNFKCWALFRQLDRADLFMEFAVKDFLSFLFTDDMTFPWLREKVLQTIKMRL